MALSILEPWRLAAAVAPFGEWLERDASATREASRTFFITGVGSDFGRALAIEEALLDGLGFYHGSKLALEGISESPGKEVKRFGIAVAAVEPGAFRRDWAGHSMVRASRSIAGHDAAFGPVRAAREERSGKQAGDPTKAARPWSASRPGAASRARGWSQVNVHRARVMQASCGRRGGPRGWRGSRSPG